MSIFSAINAEVDRAIVKRIITQKKKELRNHYVYKLTKDEVLRILDDVLKKCEEEIQE